MALKLKRAMSAMLAAAFALVAFGAAAPAWAATADYQIYPTPHTVTYAEGQVSLRRTANVTVEGGVDADTVARKDEALALKGIKQTACDTVKNDKGATNVLVGIKGSGKAVDAYAAKLVESGELAYDSALFEKTDAYVLAVLPKTASRPDTILVLGRDTDAAYYGLTTLFQIMQQVEGKDLRALTVQDYADVITRGFIEGYYGNPWSTEDRVKLMEWGGYYKLNAYVYAPKDDPKHNAKWRELYSEQELKEKIDPLAAAGNKSKCRFVFALHPFMSNPITNANYNDSVAILKKKFTQVMDHGVRQIAILADDAANQGNDLYIKLCKEMTDWIHEMQKAKKEDGTLKYPGLKDTIIFCPVNYMGQGEAWYKQLPENIQVVNTGGRVWGKIDGTFATRFQGNSQGVAPFMWINWPCSDNDKNALHMGGHNNFLGADVKPGQVKGVVLNPMQQSEPSKQGIFMNADFTWNLWKSEDHANKAWEDSFSYVDHNSPVDTKGSAALHDLSENMRWMTGGGAVWENNESPKYKDKLLAAQRKLSSGTLAKEDIAGLRTIFKELQNTAKTFTSSHGNDRMYEQMKPWMETWRDLTAAALDYLDAAEADLERNVSGMVSAYNAGQTAFDAANNHGFNYIDHTEYARVGKAAITPFVNALDSYLSDKVELAANPNADITKFVTNRTDVPEGSTDAVFDGNPSTGAVFKSPNSVKQGDYFGMTKNKPFDVTRVTIIQGDGKDFFDHSKLQYFDGKDWRDVEGQTGLAGSRIDVKGLSLKGVYGVRLVATQNNAQDAWPTINEIQINKVDTQLPAATVSMTNMVEAYGTHKEAVADSDEGTNAWFKNGEGKDFTVADAALTVTYQSAVDATSVSFKQDSGDRIESGVVEISENGTSWTEIGKVTSAAKQTFNVPTGKKVKAVRVVNKQKTEKWWKVFDLSARLAESAAMPRPQVSLEGLTVHGDNAADRVVDGNEGTIGWFKATQGGGNIKSGNAVKLTYAEPVRIGHVRFVQQNDNISSGVLEYTSNGTDWKKIANVTSAYEQEFDFDDVDVKALRIRAAADTNKWWKVAEISAAPGRYATAGQIVTNADTTDLKGQTGIGQVSIKNGSMQLAEGKYVAVDLGCVRKNVSLNKTGTTLPDGVKAAYSDNLLEWHDFADGHAAAHARYVGVKASKAATVTFAGFTASYDYVAVPTLVKDTINGEDPDAAAAFDGNLSTCAVAKGTPKKGDTIVFDLGRERTINSIAYYVPESQLDFIRNGVVEVSNSLDEHATWTPVLKINKNVVPNEYTTETAKSANWLTHDSKNPGNVYTANPKTDATRGNENDPNGTEALNVTGRYLRIRITENYSHRWVAVGEFAINGGAYESPYRNADFESSCIEVPHKSPLNLNDNKLGTVWTPSQDHGTLTYNVSEPLSKTGAPVQGIRFVSKGKLSGATVKANVYTDSNYSATAEVNLGKLDQPISEFRFGEAAKQRGVSFTAVKNVVVEWSGSVPSIAEVYLIPSVAKANTDELKAAFEKLKNTDTSKWTRDSRETFEAAKAAAQSALDPARAATLSQSYVDSVTASLKAAAKGVECYAGMTAEQLKADHVANEGDVYTASSYSDYEAAYRAFADGLANAENLSKADGDALKTAYDAAKGKLAKDATAKGQGQVALEDYKALYAGVKDVTTQSKKSMTDAAAALEAILKDESAKPAQIRKAIDALVEAEHGLVSTATLVAARAEFEKVDGSNYTADSYAAYKKAFDASTPLLENGTTEQISAAVEALNAAKAALQVKPSVDLNDLLAEIAGLNKDDYTTESWNALQEVVKRAEANPSNEIRDELIAAKKNLVNVAALKAAIARAEGLNLKPYTSESVKVLKDAVAAGKTLLVNGTQTQVDQSVASIENAIKGLDRPASKPQSGKPASGKPASGKPAQGGSAIPQTGDNIMLIVGGVVVVALVVIVAGVVVSRKNKR